MKLIWKKKNNSKKRSLAEISIRSNLPFELQNEDDEDRKATHAHTETNGEVINRRVDESSDGSFSDRKRLAESFQAQGDKLAEDAKFREALGKWESALILMPENAVLHEQKAQVLLELGEAWGALKAATRATDLEPSWAEAWITLGRAQLNFGEPDNAVKSFDRALAIKPDSREARDDQQTASHLIKRRKQLHTAGLSAAINRYVVSDNLKDADDSPTIN